MTEDKLIELMESAYLAECGFSSHPEGMKAALRAVRENAWQPIESAPKDGTQIFISGVMPWPVVAAWNGHHSAWGYASQQCELVDGEWNDYYWETDSIHPENNDLNWMPLPQPPQKENK